MVRTGIIALCFVGSCAFAKPGDVDLSFRPSLGTNWQVTAVLEQSDGKLLVAGFGPEVPGRSENQSGFLVRLFSDGRVDRSFKVRWGKESVFGPITELLIRSDNNIGALGSLVMIRGKPMHGSAVFGRTGAVRRFYSPDEDAYRASLLPDGSVVYQGTIVVTNPGIAGTFAQLRVMDSKGRKISETGFIRHSGPDGSKLTFFEWLHALPDGHVIGWVGEPQVYRGRPYSRYFLYSSLWGRTGILDTEPHGTAVAGPTNSVYLGGSYRTGYLTRRLAGWQSDPSFNYQFPEGGGQWSIWAIGVQADGKLVYSAAVKVPGVSFTLQRVYRCNADGSHDPTFDVGNGPNAPVEGVVVLQSGKILAWGPFTDFSGVPVQTFVRLEAE